MKLRSRLPKMPAPSLTFYAVATPNCQRVAIALEELECSYRVHVVDRSAQENQTSGYLALNPAGLMPVIVEGELTLAQSGAILLHLAEKHQRLLPANGLARSRTLQCFMQVMTDVQGVSGMLHLASTKVSPPHPPTLAAMEDRMGDFLSTCDGALAQAEWLAGEYSIADIALYPVMGYRRALAERRSLGHLLRWMERMAQRPAVRRGMDVGK
jgi:GST-like protein